MIPGKYSFRSIISLPREIDGNGPVGTALPAIRNVVLSRRPSGHLFVRRPLGEGETASPEKPGKHIIYNKLYSNDQSPYPAVPSREKSLAIQFARSIQSPDDIGSVYSMQSVSVLDILE
jgi:hypothetical protein